MSKSGKHRKSQKQKLSAREKKRKGIKVVGGLKELATVMDTPTPEEEIEMEPMTTEPEQPEPQPERIAGQDEISQDEAPAETTPEPFDAKKMIADLLKKRQEE